MSKNSPKEEIRILTELIRKKILKDPKKAASIVSHWNRQDSDTQKASHAEEKKIRRKKIA